MMTSKSTFLRAMVRELVVLLISMALTLLAWVGVLLLTRYFGRHFSSFFQYFIILLFYIVIRQAVSRYLLPEKKDGSPK